MCDIKAVDSVSNDNMNVQPLTVNEETMNIEASTTDKPQVKDESFVEEVIDNIDSNDKVIKDDIIKDNDETKLSTTPKVKGDDMSDASSSGDDDDENEGEDEEDDNEDSDQQGTNGSEQVITKNADGTLQIPQRYTKSGRKRSVPFPVRVS
jgi:hypothetical protein